MADLSDVEIALWSLIATDVYPGGLPAAGVTAPSPSIGAPVRVRRGWPDAARLNTDLAAGVVNVTVFSMPGHSRPTTRYIDQWRTSPVQTPPTLTYSVSGDEITFIGTGGPGQVAGVQVGPVAYSIMAPDAPADVATALAALTPGASAAGPVLTMPTSDFVVRIGAGIAEEREVRRQQQGFRVILWCPTPALRDATATVVDGALAVFDQEFLRLPDGTGGLLRYQGTLPDDVPSKADLWKRTLEYTVEYPTIQRRASPPILFPSASVTLAT